LTDFDEIWQGDADCPPPYRGQIVKISNFVKNQDGGGSHLEKSQKSRYHSNGLTDLREIWHDYVKWVS